MKEDLVYTFLYISLEILNYLSAYLIIFHAKLQERKIFFVLAILMILGIGFTVSIFAGIDAMETYSFILGILIPLFLLKKPERRWFLLYPVVFIGTSEIVVSSSFVAGIILNKSELDLLENRTVMLMCESTTIFMLLIIYIYQKFIKHEKWEIEITKRQYIILYTGVICAFIILGCVQALSDNTKMSVQMRNMYGLSIALICMIFVIMSLWQGMIYSREIRHRQQAKLYEEYMKMQEERIHTIILNDKEMRRYQHDMKAHFTAMKSYYKNHDFEGLEKYYNEAIKSSAIFTVKKYTGNVALDAVIRQLVEEAEIKRIQVIFEGILAKNFTVSVFDLCTIMSNLIKNAIEACEEIENDKAKKIKIHMLSQNEQIYILVKNTVAHKVEIKDNKLNTIKTDKKNHGWGSQNVKEAVKKYQGSLEYQYEDGWFQAEILI